MTFATDNLSSFAGLPVVKLTALETGDQDLGLPQNRGDKERYSSPRSGWSFGTRQQRVEGMRTANMLGAAAVRFLRNIRAPHIVVSTRRRKH